MCCQTDGRLLCRRTSLPQADALLRAQRERVLLALRAVEVEHRPEASLLLLRMRIEVTCPTLGAEQPARQALEQLAHVDLAEPGRALLFLFLVKVSSLFLTGARNAHRVDQLSKAKPLLSSVEVEARARIETVRFLQD